MSKNLVGMVTFGNVEFSKLTVKSIKETTESDIDFFVTTHPTGLEVSNVWGTSEIIRSKDGFDLPEISFLSRLINGSIGRNSGPHVYTQVRDNWMDESYKFLSFTYKKEGGYFILNQPVLAGKFWSPYVNDQQIVQNILEFVRAE